MPLTTSISNPVRALLVSIMHSFLEIYLPNC